MEPTSAGVRFTLMSPPPHHFNNSYTDMLSAGINPERVRLQLLKRKTCQFV
jgi:hypothetical protein